MIIRIQGEGQYRVPSAVLDDINDACGALKAGEILGRAIIEY